MAHDIRLRLDRGSIIEVGADRVLEFERGPDGREVYPVGSGQGLITKVFERREVTARATRLISAGRQ
ncbi:hypothetical protein D3C73_1633970 [compost metagenome]